MTGASGPAGHRFDPTILREYDIRGVVGKTLSAADARALGRGFGTLLRRAGGTKFGDAPRKLLDVSRSRPLGWNATTTLHEVHAKTYDWYLSRAEDPGA
jgi:nucleoside-diphosphate-sugar epimerase